MTFKKYYYRFKVVINKHLFFTPFFKNTCKNNEFLVDFSNGYLAMIFLLFCFSKFLVANITSVLYFF